LILTKNKDLASQIGYIIDFSVKSFLFVYMICSLAYLKFAIKVRSFKKVLLAILALVFCGLVILESSLESVLIATLFTVSGIFAMPFIPKKTIDD
jgi:APA family basic amino acid/polyamine antiporter